MQGSSQALCSSRLSGMDAAVGLCSSSLLHARPAGLYLARPRADHPAGKQRCRTELVGLVHVPSVQGRDLCCYRAFLRNTDGVAVSSFFSVWRLKGGRLEKEGRERARGGRREFSGRSSHSFIFPQLLVTARSLTTAVHSRKFPGGFLEYPRVVGWGSSCCWSPVEDDKPRSASSKQRPNSLLWV